MNPSAVVSGSIVDCDEDESDKLSTTNHGNRPRVYSLESCGDDQAETSSLTRNLVTEHHVAIMYSEEAPRNMASWKSRTICCKNGCTPVDHLHKYVPATKWLPQYNIKECLRSDILAGLTVGIMLIPQGVSYGLLADMPAEYGLYACLAAPVIYALLGTSVQLQIGPFALISLLVANTVGGVINPDEDEDMYVQAVLTCSMLVGILLTLIGCLRLGSLVNFLAVPVTSGLTTGGAFLIMTSQMGKFIGVDIPRGKFFPTWYHIFENIPNINVATLIIGLICLFVLMAFRKFKTTHTARVYKLRHIPMQLVVMVVATLITWGAGLFDEPFNVKTLGVVPAGLPKPSIPTAWHLIGELIVPCVVISIVGYSISMATSKTFAAKNNYDVSSNQELFALGFANLVGGMFNGYPAFSSLSRTALVHEMGAKTPLHNAVASVVIICVLLFLTPYLEYLPYSCLAAIIFDSLKSLFLQMKDPIVLWKRDKRDMVIWLVTFFAVLFLDIAIGLVVGVAFSILVLLYAISHPSVAVMGRFPKLPWLFKDLNRFSGAVKVPGVVVCRFDSALHFANREAFREHIMKAVQDRLKEGRENGEILHSVVLDASSVVDCDSSGLAALKKLQKELAEHAIELIMCSCRGLFRDILKRSRISFQEYLNLSDAVAYAEGKRIVSCVFDEEEFVTGSRSSDDEEVETKGELAPDHEVEELQESEVQDEIVIMQ